MSLAEYASGVPTDLVSNSFIGRIMGKKTVLGKRRLKIIGVKESSFQNLEKHRSVYDEHLLFFLWGPAWCLNQIPWVLKIRYPKPALRFVRKSKFCDDDCGKLSFKTLLL